MNERSSQARTGAVPTGPETASGRRDPLECVVIGGSAGAIESLLNILPALPAEFPLPILIVVHLPAEGRSLLPDIFGQRCQLPVKEAEDKETIRAGVVYFAPPNYHLLVEPNRTLSISSDEPIRFSRPSIDVLFESAADAFGTGLLALVLTGANNDGAAGSKAVAAAGGHVWVQKAERESDAVVLPESVLAVCPQARSLAVIEIAQQLEEAAVGG